jgi:hypothetical protein
MNTETNVHMVDDMDLTQPWTRTYTDTGHGMDGHRGWTWQRIWFFALGKSTAFGSAL